VPRCAHSWAAELATCARENANFKAILDLQPAVTSLDQATFGTQGSVRRVVDTNVLCACFHQGMGGHRLFFADSQGVLACMLCRCACGCNVCVCVTMQCTGQGGLCTATLR
jgi:hypothetical protein